MPRAWMRAAGWRSRYRIRRSAESALARRHWRRQGLRRRGRCRRCRRGSRRVRRVACDVLTLLDGPLSSVFQLAAGPIHGATKGRGGFLGRLAHRSAGSVGQGGFRRRRSRRGSSRWRRCLWRGSSRRWRRGRCLRRGHSRRLRRDHYLWRGGNRCATCSRGARRRSGWQALRQAGAAKAKQKRENPMIHASYSQELLCNDHRKRWRTVHALISLVPK
jgi:hypothetical protein